MLINARIGVITCCLAMLGYWLLVDFPDAQRQSWKFLNERERAWIVRRVDRDRGDAVTPKFKISLFLRGGADLRVWYVFGRGERTLVSIQFQQTLIIGGIETNALLGDTQ